MTLLSYQVIKTIAEVGSFQKAASVLGLTPSAISHTVASTEKKLGFGIFTRSKSGVTLTNQGEYLLPYINAVLNSDESLKQAVAELVGLQRGKVKVGCFASVCTNWMPAIIRHFGEQYPEIRIEVYQGTYDEVAYWVKKGVVDFGFLSASSAGDLPIAPFYRDPLLCIVPEDFDGAKDRDSISTEELSRHQFVVQREGTDADIQNFLKENRLDVQAAYHVVDDLATIAMVASGFGICIMPELVMNDMPYRVRRFHLEPEASRLIGIVSRAPKMLAPAARMLCDHITEHYRNI